MPGFKKIALVVATKDRRNKLGNLLESLKHQTYPVSLIVIVDSGDDSVEDLGDQYSELPIRYWRIQPPSATKQRNFGVKTIEDMDLIGFVDDDVVFESDAFSRMMKFWENAPTDLGGTAFNMINHPSLYASGLKSIPFVEKLGLYSTKNGTVSPSGFQTVIGTMVESQYVDWLPSGAVLWKSEVFEAFMFDEWYSGYSYLEDLDFSYRAGREYKMAVVAEARYYHYPVASGRGTAFVFGRREVLNRIYFVRKNKELNIFKCYASLLLRVMISLIQGVSKGEIRFFQRAAGNVCGIMTSIVKA